MIRTAMACLVGFVVAGCATSQDFMESRGYRPLWAGERFGWVRLVEAEPAAEALAHPVSISALALQERLAELRLVPEGEDDGSSLFTEGELEDISEPIARGLEEAQPDQEVAFAVTGRHGRLGIVAAPTATTGRVFVQDGRLELILGQARAEFLGRLRVAGIEPEFLPGRRAARVETGWRVNCAPAGGIQRRADWCSFPLSSVTSMGESPDAIVPPPAMMPAPAPKAAIPTGAVERLRTLKELLDEGLITPEDYETKKQEILDQL